MKRLILPLALLAVQARATVPQRAENPWEGAPTQSTAALRPAARELPAPLGPFSWLREYAQIAAFLADWQYLQVGNAQYGGMIEAEAGPLGNVIQTDNTLEAIWVWSRWRSWTGRADYDAHVAAAWTYCLNHPAWLEEGGLNDNYYRAHNCAWGLAAALEYEAASGDTTRRSYGRTCATYIAAHPLPLGSASGMNAMVTGWCAGSLYEYGVETERADLRAAAVEQGLDLLDFVEQDPARWLAWDEWAMSGGTMLWGLCRSVFRDAPLYGQQWLQDHVFQVPDWADWHNVDGYDWDGSWNVAYANGLFAVTEAVGDPVSSERARRIAENLLSHDTDDDGGIMAESEDPDTEDMSWVTCYLARFCVARLVGRPAPRDVGPLRLHGLLDEAVVPAGQPLELRVVVANHGLEDADSVGVVLEVDGETLQTDAFVVSAGLDTLDFASWTPPTSGRHRLRAWTVWAGDQQAANDTLCIDLNALAPPVTRSGALADAGRLPARLRDGRLELTLPAAAPLRIEVYNLLGQRVLAFTEAVPAPGLHSLRWQERAAELADGLYLLRAESGGRVALLRAPLLR
ncbi:MAG: hypothetical protein WC326_03770 [Candidatus Delongbacteria bacterium]